MKGGQGCRCILLACLPLFFFLLQSVALENGLAKTPPMGVNTWNAFHFDINEGLIMDLADNVVALGLREAGYNYLNLDDGWSNWQREADGRLLGNSSRFPSGIAALAEYVHSKGLKFGLYGDAGFKTCAGFPGNLYHEQVDAETFASWGVDYLKYDNCWTPPPTEITIEQKYARMRDALNATGRPTLFSTSEWGLSTIWTYGQKMANTWRTTGDISLSIKASWDGVMANLDNSVGLAQFAGPGGWNDPDMLEVHNPGLSLVEQQAHFALWAIMKAPLLLGADLRDIPQAVLDIVTAPEVVAFNQDPLGVAGDLVYKQGPEEVWAAPLSGGARAVVLFNRHMALNLHWTEHPVTVYWQHIGLPTDTPCMVRDAFAKKDLGVFKGNFSATVANHGARALKITPLDTSHIEEWEAWRPWSCGVAVSRPLPGQNFEGCSGSAAAKPSRFAIGASKGPLRLLNYAIALLPIVTVLSAGCVLLFSLYQRFFLRLRTQLGLAPARSHSNLDEVAVQGRGELDGEQGYQRTPGNSRKAPSRFLASPATG